MTEDGFKYDFVVIGSGYGGMIPAWRLTQAGARVLLIERGRNLRPADFQQSWDLRYLGKVYDFGYSTSLTETYRAARVLGGGSTMNSMMHQRSPSEVFDFEDPDTGRRAWPKRVTRGAMNPYFEWLERLMKVRQLEWSEVSRTGANFARLFKDAGLTCDRGSFNVGPGCVRCGFCEAGCTFEDAKLALCGGVYEEALATGNLDVEEELTALRVRELPGGGYRVDCAATVENGVASGPERSFEAPKVIVAAGPLGTVPLLMRSRDGLCRLSPALGRWVNNNGDVNFLFWLPRHYPDSVGYKSTNNGGMISYAFWREHRVTMHAGFAPVGIMAGIDARLEGHLPWGLEHKHFVKENVIHRLIPVNAMKQVPSQIRLSIDGSGKAVIDNPRTPELLAHGKLMLSLAKSVAEPAGAQVLITGIGDEPLDMGGNHILGGARMSDDPATGVVGPDGEVYGHPGLYVSDAASIPSSLGINPALTVGANALRIADRIAGGAA